MSNRVLLVDCDRVASAATAQLLSAAGYLLDVVSSFEMALQQVARSCPDLLVTPVRLGQFNGLHLVLRCRAEYPNLPIVVTADPSDAGLADEAAQYGVRFVPRGTEPQGLVRLVGEMLGDPATV
jgi:two-component system C4-dicarboxylate transport response regulator DctD